MLTHKDITTIPNVLPPSPPACLSGPTAGMSARARRAAAGAGGGEQAEGERSGGAQEGEGGLGQKAQGAGEGRRQAAGRAEAESREGRGDGDGAEGGVLSLENDRQYLFVNEKHIYAQTALCSFRRKITIQ